jgi:membrane dipeptidase
LGMLIHPSHVSPQTMRDMVKVSRTPVMFSRSGAYFVTRHLRDAPDDVLLSLKANKGAIIVPCGSDFLNKEHPEDAMIHDVVDHVFCIAELIGCEHAGLGSDLDILSG